MKRVLGAALLVGGCNRVFELTEVELPPSQEDSAVSTCWDPMRESLDEDGDELPDGCDLCPADGALSSDVDGDGDDVPDTCDPDLAGPSTVVDFDGFSVKRLWEPQSGTWMIASGGLTVLDTAPARAELTVPLAEEPRVDMIFSSLASVGVYMKVGPAKVEVSCVHEKRSGSADSLVLRVGGKSFEMPLDDGSTNGRLRVGIDANGRAYCLGKRGVMSATVTDAAATDRSTTRIGLLSSEATFTSVTVFGRK